MTSEDDDDRTVFGQKLPEANSRSANPPPARPAPGGEQTLFGMPIPGSTAGPAPSQQPAPVPQPPGQGQGYSGAQQSGNPYGAPQPSPYAPAPQQHGGYPGAPGASHPHGGMPPPHPQAAPGPAPAFPSQAPQTPYPQHAGQQPPTPGQHTPQAGHGGEDTWFGGRSIVPPAQQPSPQWQQQPGPGYHPPSAQPPHQPLHGYGHEYQNQQFPDAQPQPVQQQAAPQKKIAFADALRGSGLNIGHTSNPIIAAATDLLILLGRLRTGIVEMHAIPLRDHVMREIHSFVKKAQEHGVSQEDIEVACYALSATADDIVQTVPGTDPAYWQQFSMSAELLNDRSTGIGFFARLEQVAGLAHQRKHVLELMLTCMALGFEGKFRTEPNGGVALTRLRNEIYQRFRSIEARPGQDLSIHWMPVLLGGRRNTTRFPMWIMGGIAAGMVVALFATLSGILSSDAQASQNAILKLHDATEELALETSAGVIESEPFEAPVPAQLDRIRGLLAEDIRAGYIAVETKGDYIAMRVGSQLRFKSGSADLSSDFEDLAKRLGIVLEAEEGGIVVEGHSDNIPLSGRGRYKSNEQLSEARAQTVLGILAAHISDSARMQAVGVGPNDPLDTANTPEAREKNRRVEILLERKEQL